MNNKIHTECLDKLEKLFNDNGYATIREGKIFVRDGNENEFKEPDLFVLKNEKLFLLLEVIVTDTYETVLKKAKIMKQFGAKHIVIFEPLKYIDNTKLRAQGVKSNREVEDRFEKEWKQKEGITVLFWNEPVFTAFEAHIKKLEETNQS
jgi:hypothetical protein